MISSLNQIKPYISLMRLEKPIGIFLLLWPTLIAMWLAANGMPDYFTLGIFCAGVVVMRSAGCVINDYADREIDLHIERTKQRPLTSGAVSVKQALLLFLGLLVISLGLALQLSLATLLLSIVGLVLACAYPFAKRVTFYPQFILGLSFAWSIPLAYMQLRNSLAAETWWLFGSVICWVVAYDTQYALADRADDLKIGVKSTAIAFGRYVKPIVFMLQSCALVGLAYLGWSKGLAWQFFVGLFVALCLAIYQQYLLKQDAPKSCLKAFKNNNYFGAAIFFGLVFAL